MRWGVLAMAIISVMILTQADSKPLADSKASQASERSMVSTSSPTSSMQLSNNSRVATVATEVSRVVLACNSNMILCQARHKAEQCLNSVLMA